VWIEWITLRRSIGILGSRIIYFGWNCHRLLFYLGNCKSLSRISCSQKMGSEINWILIHHQSPKVIIGYFWNHTVSAPAVLGICLGGAILLISVAAVGCFCYRGHQHRSHKLRGVSNGYRANTFENKPLAFRKPTAVKSPSSMTGSGVPAHYLKKSPSPTGMKSPPGSGLSGTSIK